MYQFSPWVCLCALAGCTAGAGGLTVSQEEAAFGAGDVAPQASRSARAAASGRVDRGSAEGRSLPPLALLAPDAGADGSPPCSCPSVLAACTACDPGAGCVLAPAPEGTPCDDGVACTEARCRLGSCQAVAPESGVYQWFGWGGKVQALAVWPDGNLLVQGWDKDAPSCSPVWFLRRLGPAGEELQALGLDSEFDGLLALPGAQAVSWSTTGYGLLDGNGKCVWFHGEGIGAARLLGDGTLLVVGSVGPDVQPYWRHVTVQGEVVAGDTASVPGGLFVRSADGLPGGGTVLGGIGGNTKLARCVALGPEGKLLWVHDWSDAGEVMALQGNEAGIRAVTNLGITLLDAQGQVQGQDPAPLGTIMHAAALTDGGFVVAGLGAATLWTARWHPGTGWHGVAKLGPHDSANLRVAADGAATWLSIDEYGKPAVLVRVGPDGSTACNQVCSTCDDGNPCTTDACVQGLGCTHIAAVDGARCADGKACHAEDRCQGGQCQGQPDLACDDGNPCTADTCATDASCAHSPVSGLPCDDAGLCGTGATCDAGVCISPLESAWSRTYGKGRIVGTRRRSDGTFEAWRLRDEQKSCTDSGTPSSFQDWLERLTLDSAGRLTSVTPGKFDSGFKGISNADFGAVRIAWLGDGGALFGMDRGVCYYGKATYFCDGWLEVYRADAMGQNLWSYAQRVRADGELKAMTVLADGGVALVGWRGTYNGYPNDYVTLEDGQAFITRLGSDGKLLWTHPLGLGLGKLNGVAAADQGGLWLAGDWLGQGWLVRLDAAGDVAWQGLLPGAQGLQAIEGLGKGRWLAQDGLTAWVLDGAGHPLQTFPAGGRVQPIAGGFVALLPDFGGPGSVQKESPQAVARLDGDGADLWLQPLPGPSGLVRIDAGADGRLLLSGQRAGQAALVRTGAWGQLDCAGKCQGLGAKGCDDGDPCTIDTCEDQGGCGHAPRPQASSCTTANACTSGAVCSGGVCEGGKGLDCDDGSPCTADSCQPGSGCVHVAVGGPCDDGLACDSGDHCQGGACVPASVDVWSWKANDQNTSSWGGTGVVSLADGGLIAPAGEGIARLDGGGQVGWQVTFGTWNVDRFIAAPWGIAALAHAYVPGRALLRIDLGGTLLATVPIPQGFPTDLAECPDGSFVLAGSIGGDYASKGWLGRVAGDVLEWNQTLAPGNLSAVTCLADGAIVAGGQAGLAPWVVRASGSGAMQWSLPWPAYQSGGQYGSVTVVAGFADGSALASGTLGSMGWLVRLGADGKVVWTLPPPIDWVSSAVRWGNAVMLGGRVGDKPAFATVDSAGLTGPVHASSPLQGEITALAPSPGGRWVMTDGGTWAARADPDGLSTCAATPVLPGP
jgi:hypothetical protein